MPQILSGKERQLINFMREYKTATRQQLGELVGATDRLLEKAVNSTMMQREGEIYYLGQKPDHKMIMALEVLVHFRKKIKWHMHGEFPYHITFYMNDKVFDVAVIEEGEEAMMSAAINRTTVERVIAVIEDLESIKQIKIDKTLRFCTVNPLRFI
jgi:hypothetical protein